MAGKPFALALLGCAASVMTGCVAVAVVPVAAGGLIGHTRMHRHGKVARPRQPVAVTDARTAPSTPQPVPLPADPSTMKPGQYYVGQMPAPTGSAAAKQPVVTKAVAPTTGKPAGAGTSWSDVVHYVAATSLNRPDHGVLLAKGSTLAAARWVACGSKPLAVAIDLDATDDRASAGEAVLDIGAIQTMGTTLVYLSVQDPDIARHALKSLAAGGLNAPIAGETLFVGAPGKEAAWRATIADRYCVIAVVGTRLADFPNATPPSAPGASPGWFMLAAP